VRYLPRTGNGSVSPEDVKAQLRTILGSGVLAPSSRQARLLEYLCNKTLLGEADQIKETTIAVELFGKSSSFDESKDAIVRVEMFRLRKKLSMYYEGKGSRDRIWITLVPGHYAPEFSISEKETSSSEEGGGPAQEPPPPKETTGAPAGVRRRRILLAACALVIACIGVAILVQPVRRPVTSDTTARLRSLETPPPSGPPAGALRILAGSLHNKYIDRFGNEWGTDRYFHGGEATAGAKGFYGWPPDAGLFRTMRWGSFTYDVPLKPGVYELRLYFADPEYRTGGEGENQRIFDVTLNGKTLLLEHFDIVSDSGIAPVDIRTFKDIRPDADGYLHLKFSPVRGDPVLNAVEIVPGIEGRIWPIRILASNLSFTDHEGNIWQPDNYYIGGRLARQEHGAGGTPDEDMYSSQRYGNFSYAIPVPPGVYNVTLHFAETWYDPKAEAPEKGGVGSRVFDVFCNGVVLLRNLDILKEAGPYRALKKTFRGIRPNGQGKLFLSFSPQRDYASVDAIEVLDQPEEQNNRSAAAEASGSR
jgi:hypothetical protein